MRQTGISRGPWMRQTASAAILLLGLMAFGLAISVHVPTSYVERTFLPGRTYPPAEWRVTRIVGPEELVTLMFALKHRNAELMEDLFSAVSDPTHKDYGKHLSLEQVTDFFAPAKESTETLLQWLESKTQQSRELFKMTPGDEWISVTTTCEIASAMLAVEFREYSNSAQTVIRSAQPVYSLPQHIMDLVAFVGGITHFPVVASTRLQDRLAVPGPDALVVDPSVLHDVYNVSGAVGKSKDNLQAVAQFLGQYYHSWDLQEFFTLFWEESLGDSPHTLGPDLGLGGVEASLDIEYIMAMGTHVPTIFYSTGGTHQGQEPFLDWAMNVSSESRPPYVISVSYGDDEDSLSKEYTDRINEEFKKLGLRGVSLLFASGDSGVGGDSFGPSCTKFVPNYPASSPYVTAVGGTALNGIDTNYQVVNGLSGGGFSFYFDQPAYQSAAVKDYLRSERNLPNASYYNPHGRAYPDISALSSGFVVVVNLVPLPGVAGTSCAAPTASGIFSLLNDLRLQAGKPPLGFLNPFIYQTAANTIGAFFDVTEGSNPNCNTEGFPARVGWDPSSGVGTPNYAVLAKLM